MSKQPPTTDDFYKENGQADKSAGQLMKEVTEDLSSLIRQEVQLAKQEVGEAVSAKIKGAAVLAIAGTLGFFALIFMLLAIRDGLATLLWTWLADLVTAVILLAIGAAGALFAKKKLATPISTELTKESIKEDVELLKTMGRH